MDPWIINNIRIIVKMPGCTIVGTVCTKKNKKKTIKIVRFLFCECTPKPLKKFLSLLYKTCLFCLATHFQTGIPSFNAQRPDIPKFTTHSFVSNSVDKAARSDIISVYFLIQGPVLLDLSAMPV